MEKEKDVRKQIDEDVERLDSMPEAPDETTAGGVQKLRKVPPEPSNVPAKDRKLCIAILDDDAFTLLANQQMVKAAKARGYEIECKKYELSNHPEHDRNLDQFRHDLRSGQINGIITDHDMRDDWSGTLAINTVRKAKGEIQNIPILLNSADSNYKEEILQVKNVSFLKKADPKAKEIIQEFVDKVVQYDLNLRYGPTPQQFQAYKANYNQIMQPEGDENDDTIAPPHI
ncbi:hypothetical protein [Legionella septentrionalis]|uniref:hypothetical protein n=1 Tax=Legionella septentrionalis TaxID=2498109 RepID=UPI000F8EAFD9|nr:hypothetical protein [Legionella septentrionalis]RUR10719.1 hypothetical protein ELY14_04020 [Legionella septentrionalis]